MVKQRTITFKEITEIVTREESHFYDHKAFEIKGDKIQKIAVAFANADGGEFIIGIKDEKESKNPIDRWQGIDSIEDFNFVFQNLLLLCPTIPHSWEFLKDPNEKYALRIIIEKSESLHKTDKNEIYIRNSAQSSLLKDPQKIQALSYSKGESSYEDRILPNLTPEDIFESKEIINFLKDISPSSDPIDFTLNQNLIDRKCYDPKIAGILLFNDNPVTLLPKKCGIKITRYDTSQIVPERENLKQQYTVEGCLNQQIQEAANKISNIMESVQVMTPNGLGKVKYPAETIWEILVNAVIHRDYSISDDIHVLIFNNRVEIKSPGKLPGYVTIENILDARFSRNSKIVRILNKYKNPVNKDMGEGLNTAFQKMAEFRLKPPVIIEDGNYIKIVIAHTPLAAPEETIVKFLETNGQIRNREARELTGVKSENVMKRIFYKMRESNIIEAVMSKNGSKIVAWKMKNS